MPSDPPRFRDPHTGRFPARPEGGPASGLPARGGEARDPDRGPSQHDNAELMAKRAAIRELQTGRGAGAALAPPPGGDAYTPALPDTRSPAELMTALSMTALRRLERGIHDADERVAFDAARVLVTAAPKVAAMPGVVGGDASTPEAKRAAVVAALASADVIAIVLEVAATDGALRDALVAAGWVAP